MKKLWLKILAFVKKLYAKLVDETKMYIPMAIEIVQTIKEIMDSPVDDIILTVISKLIPTLPMAQVAIIKQKIEEYLPKLLLELNLVDTIANTQSLNEQLQMILDAINLSSDEVKAEKYHVLASKLLVILSDNKITWEEAVMFTEWYYQTYVKQ